MRRLNLRRRFGRKSAIAILLVSLVVFATVYAFVQLRSGYAVLTNPPPGIPGPYYVTAEATIYGPVVNLASIKNVTGGQNASDYTYVQWGTNPFYRVYADNLLQEVFYGTLTDVINQFSSMQNYPLQTNLFSTFDYLKNYGAIDPSSSVGYEKYFGNVAGAFLDTSTLGGYLVTNSKSWKATLAQARGGEYWGPGYPVYVPATMTVCLNGSQCATAYSSGILTTTQALNASGFQDGISILNWTFSGNADYGGFCSTTIYLEDLQQVQSTVAFKNFTVIDSPGTSFVSKYVSPSSPVAGSTVNVTVRLDPPRAANMNITDLYPNMFTWASVDVLLEKFKAGVGLEESAYVNVVPTPDGSNMKFTVYYNQALGILQSLQRDEYVYLTYSLRVPNTAGEYTLPSASMSYSIPTPQT